MVEVPCSRVAHAFRSKNYFKRFGDDGQDFVIRNFKRIAEVWLDEFKDVVYERNKVKYSEADVGDLIKAKAIKRGLHCKPFRYFLEFIAKDMLERYPLVDPGCFAQGAVQSRAKPGYCLEVPKSGNDRRIVLAECEKNLIKPLPKQFFKLTWHRSIQHFTFDFCLRGSSLSMGECRFTGGDQFWKFDIATSQILQNNSMCLTFDAASTSLSMKTCDSEDSNQRWNWGEKNVSALQDWNNFGIDLLKLQP